MVTWLDELSTEWAAAGIASTLTTGLIALILCWKLWKSQILTDVQLSWSGKTLPPEEGGPIPWVGCAVSFGKEPLHFIQQAHKKHGNIFTIQAAGKWLTFILDPSLYPNFFSSNSVDFQAAVLPICKKVAGISPQSFAAHHSHIHDSLKGRLSASTGFLCPALCNDLHQYLCSYGESGEKELMDFVRDAMFDSVVKQLFGHDNVPADKSSMLKMMNTFIKYDQDFEYGADLPQFLLKEWKKCKVELLDVFKQMTDSILKKERNGTLESSHRVLDMLLSIVDEESAHGYALLLLWASQSNAIPALFWTLCHILSDPECRKLAYEEVMHVSLYKDGKLQAIEEDDLKKMPYIKRCLLEAVRLHAPGMIVRKVVKTHDIDKFTIPAGHLLMLSPYWSHRNENYFPEPEKFKPDRWLTSGQDRTQFLPGFIGFGGGRYQCPGRWFALMEMHLFLVVALSTFSLQMNDPIPEPSPLHLIGTPHPISSCRVKFTRRKDT